MRRYRKESKMKHTQIKNKNEDAVSPVISVIMLVAISVILAAVIASFVFGMAGDMKPGKVVATTIKMTDQTSFTVMNMGGQDVDKLVNDGIEVNGDITNPGAVNRTVGSSSTFETKPGAGQKHVIITGTFEDGSVVVLQDTYVTRKVA
jgi:FlaG/FlaF family flagellin (archaellin)